MGCENCDWGCAAKGADGFDCGTAPRFCEKHYRALEDEVAKLRAALIEIHNIAMQHREWAISGRCVTALGPGVPGVSAPDGPPKPECCERCGSDRCCSDQGPLVAGSYVPDD